MKDEAIEQNQMEFISKALWQIMRHCEMSGGAFNSLSNLKREIDQTHENIVQLKMQANGGENMDDETNNEPAHLNQYEAAARAGAVREVLGIEATTRINLNDDTNGYAFGCAVIIWDAAKKFYEQKAKTGN